MRFLAALATLIVLGAIGLGVFGWWEARSDPIVRTARLSFADWPRGTPPMRVALLSDIHIGNAAMDAARLTRIVAAVNAAHPDLVLLAGDFVTGMGEEGAAANAAALRVPLAGLRAPLGVVAVLGNHDHWTDPIAIRRALAAADVSVLANSVARRGALTIAGIDDAFSGHADAAGTVAAAAALPPGPRLILSHGPDIPYLPLSRWPVLAGHTHCGQVVLPLIGPVAPVLERLKRERPVFTPQFRCGRIRSGDRTYIVTAGLGASLPFRIGAPPDWWLIKLGR